MAPYIEIVFQLCLTIAADEKLGDAVRAKAISWLGRVTKVNMTCIFCVSYSGDLNNKILLVCYSDAR